MIDDEKTNIHLLGGPTFDMSLGRQYIKFLQGVTLTIDKNIERKLYENILLCNLKRKFLNFKNVVHELILCLLV